MVERFFDRWDRGGVMGDCGVRYSIMGFNKAPVGGKLYGILIITRFKLIMNNRSYYKKRQMHGKN